MSVLTDEEIESIFDSHEISYRSFARAIEAAVLKRLGEQEPIAWRFSKGPITKLDSWPHGGNWKPLYEHPAPPKPEWQPIETAPKSGLFLVYRTHTNYPLVVEYDKQYGCIREFIGGELLSNITHWQHLPSPPEAK